MSKKLEMKNVKVPVELVESIKNRDSERPPGEVLLEIYKDYEYLESVARRMINAEDNQKVNIPECIDNFIKDTKIQLEKLRASNDELSMMMRGLELFFKKVKQ